LTYSELPQLPQGKLRTTTAEQVGGVNLRQVAVLSKADWEGIQYRLNKRQIEAERNQQIQEEKRRLHELSLERVKNWSNTVYVSIIVLKPFSFFLLSILFELTLQCQYFHYMLFRMKTFYKTLYIHVQYLLCNSSIKYFCIGAEAEEAGRSASTTGEGRGRTEEN
jgi:hypothetical protein